MKKLRDALLLGRLGQGLAGLLLIGAGFFGVLAVADAAGAGGADPVGIDLSAADIAGEASARAVPQTPGAPALATAVQQTPEASEEEFPPSQDDPAAADWMQRMLEEHMGLDAGQAEGWAEGMLEHMRSVHGDQADDMLAWCAENWDGTGSAGTPPAGRSGSYGGMMGGYGGSAPGGMMGGGAGGMMGGSGGSGMMGF
ncbi:MAG: hypothetical protein Kow00129_16450 [Thermoleophilia bacterium]